MRRYLSDVINMEKLLDKKTGNKICIVSGVGSGKSTWVIDCLGEYGKILFITSRKAKVDEDLTKLSDVLESYRKEILTNKHTIATNAKVAKILEGYNLQGKTIDDFLDEYDFVVLDEAHSIATDSTFTDSAVIIKSLIEKCVTCKKTFLLTGTIEPIEKYLQANEWNIYDYTKDCHCVMAKSFHLITKESAHKRIERLVGEGKRIIYFANSAADITNNLYREDKNEGVIMSDMGKFYKKHKASHVKKQMELLYREIVNNQNIPSNIQKLYSTSKLKEGVNIDNDDIEEVFCESHDISDIIQFVGRVRKGCCRVNIIINALPHGIDLNEIEYLFAKKKLVCAANDYLKEDIIDFEDSKYQLIKYITGSNQYVFFNYVTNRFELNQIRYDEQCRRQENENQWKEILFDYCVGNDISLLNWGDITKNCVVVTLKNMNNNGITLKGQQKSWYLNMIKRVFNLENQKVDTINAYLKKHRIHYQLVNRKIRSGDDKNRYELKVEKVE